MKEFEQKNYSLAREKANSIKNNGEDILSIFNRIDEIMNTLYDGVWEGDGAEEAKQRYGTIRKNYEVFYQQILEIKKHIDAVTASNEETDARVGGSIAGV